MDGGAGPSAIIGVVSGVVASAIWLAALRTFRPSLKVSPQLGHDDETENGVGRYRVKVVNRSRQALLDMKVELVFRTRIEGPIPVFRRHSIVMTRGSLVSLPGRNRKTKTNAEYAFRFSTAEDLRGIWNQLGVASTTLRFTASGRHPVSGVSRSFSADYYWNDHPLVDGRFKTGPSMVIDPMPLPNGLPNA